MIKDHISLSLENKLEPLPDGIKCRWCMDTGEFEDTEGCTWSCFDDCPRDKKEDNKEEVK